MPDQSDPTRRDVIKIAGAATAAAAITKLQGAPAVVHASTDQVKFGIIGTGGRGSYLLKHLPRSTTAIAWPFATWTMKSSIAPPASSAPIRRSTKIIANCYPTRHRIGHYRGSLV